MWSVTRRLLDEAVQRGLLAKNPTEGIRRSEAAALTIGDLVMEQGYHVAIVQHGKGNKRSLARLPVEIRQVIDEYLVAADREQCSGFCVDLNLFPREILPRKKKREMTRWTQ
jgi:site-specific recombinase XerD